MTTPPFDWPLSRRSLLGALVVAGAAAKAAPPLVLHTPDGRAVSVAVWHATGAQRGTVVFSHGALSAPGKYAALIDPWAAAGFAVFAPLHVDSTDHPDTAKFPGLSSWPARIADMRAVAAYLGDTPRLAAGHSYGGLVALSLGGVSAVLPEGVTPPLRDPQVTAVIAFSPPGPAPVLVTAAGYATLAVPALIQTGDRDLPPGSTDADAWRGHLAAYDAAAAGGHRYALVLAGVDHYFGGVICRPELPGPPQRAQFAHASAVSTLFVRGFGGDDRSARAALDAQLADTGPVQLRRK